MLFPLLPRLTLFHLSYTRPPIASKGYRDRTVGEVKEKMMEDGYGQECIISFTQSSKGLMHDMTEFLMMMGFTDSNRVPVIISPKGTAHGPGRLHDII